MLPQCDWRSPTSSGCASISFYPLRARTMTEPLLRMSLISKRFPGVQALDNAGLEVLPGEIHALLGENGAGKSTLIKILSGAQQPDKGTIEFAGQNVTMTSPHDAQRRGIVTIYQEFTLAPHGSAYSCDRCRSFANCASLSNRWSRSREPSR
jgi:ABC-type branched-subunit amino acid transport system ATPase component